MTKFFVILALIISMVTISYAENHVIDFEELQPGDYPLDAYLKEKGVYIDGRLKVLGGSYVEGENSLISDFGGGVDNHYIIFDYPIKSISLLIRELTFYVTRPRVTAYGKNDEIIQEWSETEVGEIVECNLNSTETNIYYITLTSFDAAVTIDYLAWSSPQGVYGFVYDVNDNPVEALILVCSRNGQPTSVVGSGISEYGEYFIEITAPGIYFAFCLAEGYLDQRKVVVIYPNKPTRVDFLLQPE